MRLSNANRMFDKNISFNKHYLELTQSTFYLKYYTYLYTNIKGKLFRSFQNSINFIFSELNLEFKL